MLGADVGCVGPALMVTCMLSLVFLHLEALGFSLWVCCLAHSVCLVSRLSRWHPTTGLLAYFQDKGSYEFLKAVTVYSKCSIGVPGQLNPSLVLSETRYLFPFCTNRSHHTSPNRKNESRACKIKSEILSICNVVMRNIQQIGMVASSKLYIDHCFSHYGKSCSSIQRLYIIKENK